MELALFQLKQLRMPLRRAADNSSAFSSRNFCRESMTQMPFTICVINFCPRETNLSFWSRKYFRNKILISVGHLVLCGKRKSEAFRILFSQNQSENLCENYERAFHTLQVLWFLWEHKHDSNRKFGFWSVSPFPDGGFQNTGPSPSQKSS